MTDLEERLRDAFAARADLVTPQSLRPEAAPPARRRLPRWVVPGMTGLAVAATAAGVLVATAPHRDAAEPGRPSSSPSPAPSLTTVPPPALPRTLRGSGWSVRVPATWRTHPNDSTATRATITCVGPDEQPCQLRLAAGVDRTAVPDPGRLGGGLLPGLDPNSCREVGATTGIRVEGGAAEGEAAALTEWACGNVHYQQVAMPTRMLLVVARTSDGPAVSAAVRTLRLDPAYVVR